MAVDKVTIKMPEEFRARANYLMAKIEATQQGIWHRGLQCLAKKHKIDFGQLILARDKKDRLIYIDNLEPPIK